MFKNELQNYWQLRGYAPPKYPEHRREGPPHMPIFQAWVQFGPNIKVQGGNSTSKKGAEMLAAERALKLCKMHVITDDTRDEVYSYNPGTDDICAFYTSNKSEQHSPSTGKKVSNLGLPPLTDSGVYVFPLPQFSDSVSPNVTASKVTPSKVTPSKVTVPKAISASSLTPQANIYPASASKPSTSNPLTLYSQNVNRLDVQDLKQALPSYQFEGRCAIYVDVENLHNLTREVAQVATGLDIYAVVGEHHPSAAKDYPDNVTVIRSHTNHANGADICMTMIVTTHLVQNQYDLYLIGTRDKFGSALVDLISSDHYGWEAKEARLITRVDQL